MTTAHARSDSAISLLDISTYLPGEPVSADYYAGFAESDDLRENVMFRAPKSRHHVAADETAVDMVERNRRRHGFRGAHEHPALEVVVEPAAPDDGERRLDPAGGKLGRLCELKW